MKTFAQHQINALMSLQVIEQYITGQLPNVTTLDAMGYRFFFYADEQVLPFATMALSDNEYDKVSDLDREGVYRLNIGVPKEMFEQLFPEPGGEWDYTSLNIFMPHPHYAAQHFICILNPENEQLAAALEYAGAAYLLAKTRYERKRKAR
jgi:hypothetical protein